MLQRISFCLFLLGVALVSANVPEEYIPSPMGYVLKRCHHQVPSGSHLSRMPDGRMKVTRSDGSFHSVLPLCDGKGSPVFRPHTQSNSAARKSVNASLPADYDGWEAYTAFKYNPGFDAFLGDFSVPDAPSEDPQVLYLFTGLQNINWIPKVDPMPITPFDIIQPVLQYPGDFGNYWSVKSWYVTLDVGTVASNEVKVDAGDTIFGNMTRTGPTSWFIGSTSVASGKSTTVTVDHPRLKIQPWAYNTLECYGCTSCATYPKGSPCLFSKLMLTSKGRMVTPTWSVNPQPSHDMKCHEMPVVNSNSAVTIYFNKP